MNRAFVIILLLAALGAGAWYERELLMPYWQKAADQLHLASLPGATPAPTPSGPATPAPETATTYHGPVAPEEPQKAAPGTFFIVQRAKVITATGVQAVNPGELVRLLERLPKDRLRVTTGNAIFDVDQAQVTDDLATAREAERRFRAAPEGAR